MNIEAQIKNWQNKFNKGESHPCRSCHKPVYMGKSGSYSGPCPHCNERLNYSAILIEDGFNASDGGMVGVGKPKIYLKHFIVFAVWWTISVVASAIVTGVIGIVLSVLFNLLLTIIGFRTFTFEINNERF